MSGFGNYVHTIVDRAGHEAREEGSSTTEAQHLLLAMAAEPEPTTRALLTSVGLDRRAIRDALDRELDRSLGSVGVSRAVFDLPRASHDLGRPRLGASAKLALERGLGSAARKSELRPAHLLLGVLRADVGTVPRALEMAGVDRDDLRERVLQTLTAAGDA